MKKINILILCFVFGFTNLFCSDDPFEKIVVKSESATFSKNKKDSELFCLKYKNNVRVTFADSTEIKSDYLEIFVKEKKTVETVVFKDNVKIDRDNRKIQADKVELFVQEKLCKASGQVKIEQIKNGDKDVPMVTNCDCAEFAWDKEELELVGSKQKPVCTQIELGGKLKLFRKKKQVEKKKTS